MKKEKKSHFNLWVYVMITVCILSSSIAYSALNATLKITGEVKISKKSTPYLLPGLEYSEPKFYDTGIDRNKIKAICFGKDQAWSGVPDSHTIYTLAGGTIMIWAREKSGYYYISIFCMTEDGTQMQWSQPVIFESYTLDSYFARCSALETVIFDNVDFTRVTTTEAMFANCSNLTTIDAPSTISAPKLHNMYNMFGGCSKLPNTKFLESFQLSNNIVSDMNYIFEGCEALTSINLNNITTADSFEMSLPFNGCTSLKTVYLNTIDFVGKTLEWGPPVFGGIPSGLTIYALNAANKSWIESQLSVLGITATVRVI